MTIVNIVPMIRLGLEFTYAFGYITTNTFGPIRPGESLNKRFSSASATLINALLSL